MTHDEIVAELNRWIAHYWRVTAATKLLKQAFEHSPEGAVPQALWLLFDAYMDAKAQNLGDTEGWLAWFLWDNDAGKKGLKAKAASWKKERPIKNLHDLAALIEGCN